MLVMQACVLISSMFVDIWHSLFCLIAIFQNKVKLNGEVY